MQRGLSLPFALTNQKAMTDDKIVRTAELDLHPVRGKDGTIELYDMYVIVDRGKPEWIGWQSKPCEKGNEIKERKFHR
jgi:hypothetical protein